MNFGTVKAVGVALALGAILCLVQELRIRELQTTNTRLQGEVDLQSSQTDTAAAKGKTEKAEADGRALEIKAGAAELKAKLPKGHGPAVMNAWFTEVVP
jgi:hypothetical protein